MGFGIILNNERKEQWVRLVTSEVNEQKIHLLVRIVYCVVFPQPVLLFKSEETECGNIVGKDNSILIFLTKLIDRKENQIYRQSDVW
jgi:hypothetical protein